MPTEPVKQKSLNRQQSRKEEIIDLMTFDDKTFSTKNEQQQQKQPSNVDFDSPDYLVLYQVRRTIKKQKEIAEKNHDPKSILDKFNQKPDSFMTRLGPGGPINVNVI